MSRATKPIKADYNRDAPCPAPGRLAWIIHGPLTPRRIALVLACTVLLIIALLPLDAPAMRFMGRFLEGGRWEIKGDLKRELLFIQQWGDLVCILLVLAAVWLLDKARRPRLWDAAAAIATTAVLIKVLKILIGRPRPVFHDPSFFCGPFRQYPLTREGVTDLYYPWQVWRPIWSDLWSMPSSHTAAAVCLSVILVRLYPRLAVLAVPLVLVVGACRMLFSAHYPTDVVAGLGLGFVAASLAMDRTWGQRLAIRLRLARLPLAA